MTTASETARYLLILHALVGIVQGFCYFSNPCGWKSTSGILSSSPHAVQVAGLGYIGLGWYQLIFAYKNHLSLLAGSVPLRSFYARIVWTCEGWGYTLAFEIVGWALTTVAGHPENKTLVNWIWRTKSADEGKEKEKGIEEDVSE